MRRNRPWRRLRRKLTYQRLIPLLALASGLPAVVLSLVLLWSGDFAPRIRMDARPPRRRRLGRSALPAAGAPHPAPARRLQHARGDPRGGLLASHPHPQPERRSRAHPARAQRADPDVPRPAARRSRGLEPPDPRARRHRRGAVRVRRREPPATAEPGRREPARTTPGGARSVSTPRSSGLAECLAGETAARDELRRGAGIRSLGASPPDVSLGRPSAPAGRARRSQPGAPRGGADRLAAADPRAEPRDQQLPDPDQVDRREPVDDARAGRRLDARTRSRCGTTCARACG